MWQLFITFGAFVGLLAYVNRWYRKPFIGQYTDKRVFITGTDTGFGFALALNLDKCGVKVYAGCYTEEGAENLQKSASDRLKIVALDVTKVESVLRAKEEIEKDLGPGQELWGLVNNAGILPGGAPIFPMSSTEDYRRALEVNFFGAMNVTTAFVPLLLKSAGRIVNVISIAGRVSIGLEPYTCSKFALEPYTDGLRRWLRNFDTHVAIIEPGIFKTKLTENLLDEKEVFSRKENLLRFLPQTHVEKILKIIEASIKDSVKIKLNPPLAGFNHVKRITDDIKHALFAKHPKDRYVCGLDAMYFYRLLILLPDWINDLIIFLHVRCTVDALKESHN